MSEAAKKFLGDPDPKQEPPMSPVVEKLLPFLDVTDTLHLHQSGTMCLLKHLQRDAVVWKKLVLRALPENYKVEWGYNYNTRARDALVEKRVELGSLIDILKMLEEPNSYLLYLLQLICEKSPPDERIAVIQISNPSTGSSYSVSSLGFMLCEEVEAAFGSAVQKVEQIELTCLEEPWLSALAARVSRQEQKVTNMRSETVELTNKASAEALSTLVQCGEK